MRFVIASFVCFIECGLYLAVFALLGSTVLEPGGASAMVRILALVPLALIAGATWSGITKQAFPRSLDPFGILSRDQSDTKSHPDEERKKLEKPTSHDQQV